MRRMSLQTAGYPMIPGGILTAAFANWWIDPVNGNDGNSGLTSGSPLKTCARRQTIWGPMPSIAPGVAVTVNYVNANLATDPENYNVLIGSTGSLTLLGSMTQSKTGTLQAVTTSVPSTSTPWDVTDAIGNLGAADLGKLIRITGGARAGAYALMLKDLGAGKVRTTPFGTFAVSTTIATAFAVVTPQAGDPYEVVSPTNLGIGTIQFTRQGPNDPASAPLRDAVLIDSLVLSPGVATTDSHIFGYAPIFIARGGTFRLKITSADYYCQAGGRVGTCSFDGPGRAAGITATLEGTMPLILAGVGNLQFAVNSDSQNNILRTGCVACTSGCNFSQRWQVEGYLMAEDMAIFDWANAIASVIVNPGGVVRQLGSGQGLWGTANTGYGVQVKSGGQLTYRTKPVINSGLGAGREATVGGTDKLWSAIPYVETANNAMIVAEVP